MPGPEALEAVGFAVETRTRLGEALDPVRDTCFVDLTCVDSGKGGKGYVGIGPVGMSVSFSLIGAFRQVGAAVFGVVEVGLVFDPAAVTARGRCRNRR